MSLTSQEKAIRKRLRDDFDYYSRRCLSINTKDGTSKKLIMNKAQRYVHDRLEKQLKENGRVRAIVF